MNKYLRVVRKYFGKKKNTQEYKQKKLHPRYETLSTI